MLKNNKSLLSGKNDKKNVIYISNGFAQEIFGTRVKKILDRNFNLQILNLQDDYSLPFKDKVFGVFLEIRQLTYVLVIITTYLLVKFRYIFLRPFKLYSLINHQSPFIDMVKFFIHYLIRLHKLVSTNIKQLLKFRALVKNQRIDFIIIPDESILFPGANLYSKIINKKITVILVPFSEGIRAEFLSVFGDFQQLDEFRKIDSLLVSKIWPNYNLNSTSSSHGFPALVHILLWQYFGLLPKDPWSGFMGLADWYLFTSNYDAEECMIVAGNKQRIRVIEPVEFSLVQEKNKLSSKELNSANEKFEKNLLVCLPPNQFPLTYKNECSFNNYRDMISFVYIHIEKIKNELDLNVVYLGHPRLIKNDIQLLPPELTQFLSDSDFTDNIMFADTVLTFGSGLTNKSLEFNKKVINWNIYDYQFMFNADEKYAVNYFLIKNISQANDVIRLATQKDVVRIDKPKKDSLLDLITNIAY